VWDVNDGATLFGIGATPARQPPCCTIMIACDASCRSKHTPRRGQARSLNEQAWS
jgi:hypothetical protein